MNSRNSPTTVAVLGKVDDKLRFLGTAFALRRAGCFMSAAHCVGTLAASSIFLLDGSLNQGKRISVTRIVRCPDADLAMLEIEARLAFSATRFHTFAKSSSGAGSDVSAIGYQEESGDQDSIALTRRVFRGSIQRRFFHTSHLGVEYEAIELSFAAPAGLSGGPVYSSSTGIHLIGVVTENFQSTTFLQSVAEIQDKGNTYVEKIHERIQYGICVDLDSYERWVDQTFGGELG